MVLAHNIYDENVRSIKSIKFGVWSGEKIKDYSVTAIDHTDLYDNLEPKRGGPVDDRMGALNRYSLCGSCGLDAVHDPGHFAHHELAVPVFWIQFFKPVRQILSVVCLRCRNLLINTEDEAIVEKLRRK